MNYDKRAMSKQGVCWYKIDEFAYAKGIPHFNCVHVLTRGGSGGQKIGYKVQNRTKSITSVKKKQVLRFRITIAVKCYQPKTTRKVGNLKISSFY